MTARLEGRPNHYRQSMRTLQTYVIVGSIIGVVTKRTVHWYKIEIEKCLSTLTETSIPVDHGKRSETECTDSNTAIKVDSGSRSIRVR
jgi:hypothetical protein